MSKLMQMDFLSEFGGFFCVLFFLTPSVYSILAFAAVLSSLLFSLVSPPLRIWKAVFFYCRSSSWRPEECSKGGRL